MQLRLGRLAHGERLTVVVRFIFVFPVVVSILRERLEMVRITVATTTGGIVIAEGGLLLVELHLLLLLLLLLIEIR